MNEPDIALENKGEELIKIKCTECLQLFYMKAKHVGQIHTCPYCNAKSTLIVEKNEQDKNTARG